MLPPALRVILLSFAHLCIPSWLSSLAYPLCVPVLYFPLFLSFPLCSHFKPITGHNRSPPRSAHNPSFDSISPVPQARGPPPIPTSDSNGASKGRERASRFDRPAAPPPILTALEDDDSHVPDEFLESVKPATPQETSNYQASSSAVEQAHDAPPAAQRMCWYRWHLHLVNAHHHRPQTPSAPGCDIPNEPSWTWAFWTEP